MVLSEIAIAVAGALVVIVVPGYALTRTLFASRELDAMESIALTLALGLLAMPAILITLNKTIRMRITAFNTSLIILAILAYTLLYIGYLRVQNRKEGARKQEAKRPLKQDSDASSAGKPRR